ncbi:DUF2927 domain-containing protein [Alphaproteobacteria bacterium KMM 3653]|uniref:DUF2927 domain-containing protein n=1 Tax=Harenicola maris TaxID=2841044 RepID=A0AAP2G3E0_9RHOB|nr:DUF2927 domain-containing protein [Harenicola maris]
MFPRLLPAALSLLLAACAATPTPNVAERRGNFAGDLPPMKTFAAPRSQRPTRSNTDLARDFMELSFRMESGRRLPKLTRFEGPITVAVSGNAPGSLQGDLTRLIQRFRSEAGIDISQTSSASEANIVIEVISKRELQRLVPQAACFVVPRISSWKEFKRARRGSVVDWTTLVTREKAAIFLPGDVSPQEVRDCLHEEIAQALGPLNDLYRLQDSVFNDDNFHTVLTGFDMMMLRAYYHPALRNGMSEQEVGARINAVLGQINPGGQGRAVRNTPSTPRVWKDAIETALGPKGSAEARIGAAKRAVSIAKSRGWTDGRTAFALYALGRLSLVREPELSLASFLESAQLYKANPETQVQAAHVAMQLAAFSLSAGQADSTLVLVNQSLPAVRDAENAALLATLLLLKAEALDLMGRTPEAEGVRANGLGWAQYGFGTGPTVRARVSEIAALKPRRTIQ